jgi:hypothetical protein
MEEVWVKVSDMRHYMWPWILSCVLQSHWEAFLHMSLCVKQKDNPGLYASWHHSVWDGQSVTKGARQKFDAVVNAQLRVLSLKHEREVQMHMENRLSRSRLYGDKKPKPPPGEKIRHYFPSHICFVLINFCFSWIL